MSKNKLKKDEISLDNDIVKILDDNLKVIDGELSNRFGTAVKLRQYIHKLLNTEPFYKEENDN